MKKLLITLLLLGTISSYCAEQQEDLVTPILNQIKQEIKTSPAESWDNLDAFLKSEPASLFKVHIAALSPADKNRLMTLIHRHSIDNDELWPAVRDFLALIIQMGAHVDTPLGLNETLLGASAIQQDKQGVEFALKNHADATLKSAARYYPLNVIHDYDLAKLLIKHNGLEPFKANQYRQNGLLTSCMEAQSPAKLLDLYRKNGLNLAFTDSSGWTLLHDLCAKASQHTIEQFFQKFQILFNAGAINPEIGTNKDKTPLDIINEQDQNNKTVQLAKGLLIDLKNAPHIWKSKLASIEQTKAIQQAWDKSA